MCILSFGSQHEEALGINPIQFVPALCPNDIQTTACVPWCTSLTFLALVWAPEPGPHSLPPPRWQEEKRRGKGRNHTTLSLPAAFGAVSEKQVDNLAPSLPSSPSTLLFSSPTSKILLTPPPAKETLACPGVRCFH